MTAMSKVSGVTRLAGTFLAIGLAGACSASSSSSVTFPNTTSASGPLGSSHIACAGTWTCISKAARQLDLTLLEPTHRGRTKFVRINSLPAGSYGAGLIYEYRTSARSARTITVTETSRPQTISPSSTPVGTPVRGVAGHFEQTSQGPVLAWHTATEAWILVLPARTTLKAAVAVADGYATTT
jgi:hypothetical protein